MSYSSGVCTVHSTRTFAEEGTYPLTITVTDDANQSAIITGTATVADAALTAGTLTPPSATEGSGFINAVVFHFSDADPNGTVNDYVATVNTGDTTLDSVANPSNVQIVANNGGFDVRLSYTYVEELTGATFSVTVTDHNSTAGSSTTFNVTDEPVNAAGFNIYSTEGESFSGAVATFTDPDPNGANSDYSATIDWGDGAPAETGVIGTGFTVSGAHTYAEEGHYSVAVTIHHGTANDTTAYSSANVADFRPVIDSLVPSSTSIQENDSVSIAGRFTDHGLADAHTVTVSWGDPNSVAASTFALNATSSLSAGQIYASSTDTTSLTIVSANHVTGVICFTVAHRYLDDGIAPGNGTSSDVSTIRVTVSDDEGVASAAATTDVVVANLAPSLSGMTNSSPDCGNAFMGINPVTISAAFTDVGTLDTHAAMVNWGDGHTTAGTVSESQGIGSVSGRHVYAAGGMFTITVTLTDDDGGMSQISTRTTIGGVGLHDGQLQIIGTDARDIVHVGLDDENDHGHANRTLQVHVQFNLPNPGHADDDDDDDAHGTWFTYDASAVTSILILGCNGEDHLHVDDNVVVPTTIDGGAGNDSIWGGGGLDTIIDILGNNEIHAGKGNDVITVGNGANKIWTDGGADLITAGNGNNEIHSGRGNDVVVVGNGANKISTDGGSDTITAGNGANEIHAGSGNNEIHTGDGNDSISTGSGKDKIYSGGGNDHIDAGNGDNYIDAGAGDDIVRAGSGNDTIYGGAGDDILIGGAGDDILYGGNGRNILIGGAGAGADKLYGGGQDDMLIAGSTAYDANDAALAAIMSEWSSNQSYADRVMDLMGATATSVVAANGLTLTRSTPFSARLNGNVYLSGADVPGLGNQTVFSDVSYSGGVSPHSVKLGDFNNDNILDIGTVTNNSASVLLGNGDGTFQAPLTVSMIGNNINLVVGDFNRDGNLDMASSNTASNGTINVLRGHGDGSFDPFTSYYAFSAPVYLASGDFNHDGYDDFAVANSYSATSMSVIMNNGDGTYAAPHSYGIAATGYEIEVADFNSDGNDDFAVRSNSLYMVSLGKGDGTFYPSVNYSTPAGRFEAGTHGDFNGDGSVDLAYPTSTGVTVLQNDAADAQNLAGAVTFRVTAPATTTSGSVLPMTITAVDADGNVATGFRGLVFISSSDPAATTAAGYAFNPNDAGIPYVFSASDAGTHAFTGAIRLVTAGDQTVKVAAPNMVTGTATVTVTGQITRLNVSAPTASVAGDTLSVTVSAINSEGAVATDYTIVVHFTSTDTLAGLPSDYAFTAEDAGSHTFTVTLKTAGIDTINVKESGGTIGGSANISVSPAAVTSFALAGPGGSIGVARPVTIVARDSFGNTVTGYNGTVNLSSSDPAAVFPAAVSLVNGVATINVKFLSVGTQTVTAIDTADATIFGIMSSDATPPVAALFTVTGYPATTAGVANTFTVTVRDTIGQVATDYAGTIYFNSSDVQAGLPTSYTFTAADAGTHTFAGTFRTAGSQSISVRDTTGLLMGAEGGIAVSPAAFSKFILSVPNGMDSKGHILVTADDTISLTIKAVDTFGNVITNYSGTVTFSSTDVLAGLPANYTFVTADAGAHTFNVGLHTATVNGQVWSITVTDAVNSAALATITNFEVVNGVATNFVASVPSQIVAGTAFTSKVTTRDAWGNTVKNYFGTVHLSSSSANASLPTDYTFDASDLGVHDFSIGLNTSGAQTLTVTDAGNSQLGTTASATVKAAAANSTAFARFSSGVRVHPLLHVEGPEIGDREGCRNRLGERLQVVEVPLVAPTGPILLAPFQEEIKCRDNGGANKTSRGETRPLSHELMIEGECSRLVSAESDLLAVKLNAPSAALGAEIGHRMFGQRETSLKRVTAKEGSFPQGVGSSLGNYSLTKSLTMLVRGKSESTQV